MKIHGKKIEGPNEEIIPIPRSSGDIIFKASAVLDYEPFEKLCPVPKAPEVLKPGGAKYYDVEDKKYLEEINKWSRLKTSWMILQSLKATDGLEWESVDMSKPETWDNLESELESSGFTPIEISKIINGVISANGLDDQKMEEARKRFLASQQAPKVEK